MALSDVTSASLGWVAEEEHQSWRRLQQCRDAPDERAGVNRSLEQPKGKEGVRKAFLSPCSSSSKFEFLDLGSFKN